MASSDLYLTTESEITSIANAIRSKGGTLDFLTYPTGFVTAIEEIQTGGALQSKSVTPTESSVTVVPDIGYDGLSQVSVDAISSNYVGSGVAQKSAATYTPTTTNQTIASDQYLSGAQTIAGDSNLIAGNIKNGTTIFGVSGTFGPDDIIVIGDYGLCFNNFTITGNTCTSEAGTVSGNTLIAV